MLLKIYFYDQRLRDYSPHTSLRAERGDPVQQYGYINTWIATAASGFAMTMGDILDCFVNKADSQ